MAAAARVHDHSINQQLKHTQLSAIAAFFFLATTLFLALTFVYTAVECALLQTSAA
jgi:hypothetical protein